MSASGLGAIEEGFSPEEGKDVPPSGGTTDRLVTDRTPHERLIDLGVQPIGRACEFLPEIQSVMEKTPLFAGLDIQETGKLADLMYVYKAPAGATIVREGADGDFMFLIISGSVEVLRLNKKRYRARIGLASAGQCLGEMSMFDGEPRFASCVALEPTELAVLTRSALVLVLGDDLKLGNKILLKLVQLSSERLRQTTVQLVEQLETASRS